MKKIINQELAAVLFKDGFLESEAWRNPGVVENRSSPLTEVVEELEGSSDTPIAEIIPSLGLYTVDDILRYVFGNNHVLEKCAEDLCGKIKIGEEWMDIPKKYKGDAVRHDNYSIDYLCPGCESRMNIDFNRLNSTYGSDIEGLKPGRTVEEVITNPQVFEYFSKFAVVAFTMDNGLVLLKLPDDYSRANGKDVKNVKNAVKKKDQTIGEFRDMVRGYENAKEEGELYLNSVQRVAILNERKN